MVQEQASDDTETLLQLLVPPQNPTPTPDQTPCDFCTDTPAVVYCRADTACLCLRCDREVHAANTVSSRHARSILCDSCRAAASTVACSCRGFLCSNCDFDAHGGGDDMGHGRRGVEGYVGCPSAAELAALVGVGLEECEKRDVEGLVGVELESGCEMEKFFRLEDLIVPTTCHGFHALQTTPLIKNRYSPVGRHTDEICRQLRELIKSDNLLGAFSEDIEPVSEMFNWDLNYSQLDGNFGLDANHDSSNIIVPICKDGTWISSNLNATTDTDSIEIPYEQYLVITPEAELSTFVEMADICPTTSQENSTKKTASEVIHVLPVKNGPDFVCPDRDSVISRYKEKRKARRYEKLIRYESRKARADGRLRIKGRFAKADQTN
ncbi:B-box zinc finger family protein [Rhynchospora pubera]|uniref:B-box zinc finger family protein n=1 Tax=Rhynchospora pubera TaxID=906938 RepID=A0AAV8HEG8_9POAL|nr:B-box zinc finger family protein [Rhynchospora pubera]